MEKNVGRIDKAIRIIAGVLLIGAGIFYKNWLGLTGLVPLFTAVTGWCPLYSVLGVNTCKK